MEICVYIYNQSCIRLWYCDTYSNGLNPVDAWSSLIHSFDNCLCAAQDTPMAESQILAQLLEDVPGWAAPATGFNHGLRKKVGLRQDWSLVRLWSEPYHRIVRVKYWALGMCLHHVVLVLLSLTVCKCPCLTVKTSRLTALSFCLVVLFAYLLSPSQTATHGRSLKERAR